MHANPRQEREAEEGKVKVKEVAYEFGETIQLLLQFNDLRRLNAPLGAKMGTACITNRHKECDEENQRTRTPIAAGNLEFRPIHIVAFWNQALTRELSVDVALFKKGLPIFGICGRTEFMQLRFMRGKESKKANEAK